MADERIDVEVSRFDGEGIMFFFCILPYRD